MSSRRLASALLATALAIGTAVVLPTVSHAAPAAPAPAKPISSFTLGADMDGDKHGEILAVDAAGTLWAYPGKADGSLATPVHLAAGLDRYQVFGPGDLTGDGQADILGIAPDGTLWLFQGDGLRPLAAPAQVGAGWSGWRLIPAGDLTGDGKADLLGINAQGNLFLFAGKGNGRFAARVQVGSGWTGWRLQAAGDLNGDGKADILGINSAGGLYLYLGKGNGKFFPRQSAGSGWNTFALAGGADLSGDGKADILGCDQASDVLYYYRGIGNARFAARVQIDTGWCTATVAAPAPAATPKPAPAATPEPTPPRADPPYTTWSTRYLKTQSSALAAQIKASNPDNPIIQLLADQVGKRYRYGTAGPNTFDCSGLVYYAYKTVYGKTLPRSAGAMGRSATPVSWSDIQPGDLIWSSSHMTMYVGNGYVIAAENTRSGVVIGNAGYWKAHGYHVSRLG